MDLLNASSGVDRLLRKRNEDKVAWLFLHPVALNIGGSAGSYSLAFEGRTILDVGCDFLSLLSQICG